MGLSLPKTDEIMPDGSKHHRRSIRLKEYDYSRPGSYFVTICADNRKCLFGEIKDGQFLFNPVGEMVRKWWLKIPEKFVNVQTDKFVIMPNHLHGIIVLVGADPCVYPMTGEPVRKAQGRHTDSPLPKIIQWFKTMTANEYMRMLKGQNLQPAAKLLWQRNYYEHIVRSEESQNKIREYILANPLQWEMDLENPLVQSNSATRDNILKAEKDFWKKLRKHKL